MKIDFALPTDGKEHRFCFNCRAEHVQKVQKDGKTMFFCQACGQTNPRAIYFNKHKFWTDDTDELWHEASGIFVRGADGKFLFFQRTEFPISLTVPAGHVDIGEAADVTAIRELEEEVGIKARQVHHVATEEVHGDSCSAGADVHRWHAYLFKLQSDQPITVGEEGEKPVWLSLAEAQARGLAFVVDRMVRLHGQRLTSL